MSPGTYVSSYVRVTRERGSCYLLLDRAPSYEDGSPANRLHEDSGVNSTIGEDDDDDGVGIEEVHLSPLAWPPGPELVATERGNTTKGAVERLSLAVRISLEALADHRSAST
ncbi:hypothetical protein AOLI_G00065620 [Acnodon oligacanthus]